MPRTTTQIDGRSFLLNPDYNSLGQVKDLSYPDALKVGYSPNAWGEPTELASTYGAVAGTAYASNIQYHPNGRVASYALGNGLSYQQGLDTRQRPNLQDTRYGSAVFQRLRYAYSQGGNLNQITDDVDGTNSATLGYDNLNRLTTANGLWGSYTYGYDPINNLRSRNGSNPLSYAYEASSNRLTLRHWHAGRANADCGTASAATWSIGTRCAGGTQSGDAAGSGTGWRSDHAFAATAAETARSCRPLLRCAVRAARQYRSVQHSTRG